MLQEQSFKVSELERASIFILAYRWATLGLVGILLLLSLAPKDNFVPPTLLIGLVLVYNLALTVGRKRVVGAVWKYPLLLSVDLILSPLFIGLSSGWRSPYFLYGLSSIITAAFFFQVIGALASVLFYSLAYTLSLFITGHSPSAVPRGELDSYVTHYFTFLFVAGVIAFLSELMKRLREALAENVRLYEKSQDLVLMEERGRIATEMHDSVVQNLSGAGLILDACLKVIPPELRQTKEKLGNVRALIGESLKNLRYCIFNLRPQNLQAGLVPFFKLYTKEFSQANSVSVDLVLKGEEKRTDKNIEKNIYYLLQEALANVVKHAKADKIWVGLDFAKDGLTVEIKDNGLGFEVKEAYRKAADGSTLGLLSMKERVEQLTGDFTVESLSNEGTTITARIPY